MSNVASFVTKQPKTLSMSDNVYQVLKKNTNKHISNNTAASNCYLVSEATPVRDARNKKCRRAWVCKARVCPLVDHHR